MHFSKYTLAVAALASSVFAQNVKVHVVKVSGTTNMLTFSPNKLTAAMGEMVQFQFGVGNHTVTQSTFDGPCVPVSNKTGVAGVHSGFMPVAANAVNVPTYTIPITSTAPMWLYCAQGKHCQSGMVMVINENTTANATRSLENYTTGAKAAPANIAPAGGATNGTSGQTTLSTSTGTGSGSSASGSARASSTATMTGARASNQTVIASGADAIYAPHLAGMLAIGAALLL